MHKKRNQFGKVYHPGKHYRAWKQKGTAGQWKEANRRFRKCKRLRKISRLARRKNRSK